MSTVFDELSEALRRGGADEVLDWLAERLRSEKRYHELFEALKMRARRNVGLPLLYSETPETLTDEQRDRLEEGLLAACREVGTLLIRNGAIRHGWMYLRPVGDRGLAIEALQSIDPHEANVDELIEVTLHEGVDLERGYQLVLEHRGTCNAITTFETVIAQRPRSDRQAAAGLLVRQLHRELLHSLRTDIARQEGKEPQETTIRELVADRDWLFGEFAYHVDTTHLAATVRFARLLDQPDLLKLALDLTEYGRRLSSQFQYRGEEPFTDIYPSHALFFGALLGENVDAAIVTFRERARELDAEQHGTVAIETYVDLLGRLGRYQEALDAALQMTPRDAQPCGIAPSLLELSELAANFEPLLQYYRGQDNLLGFATGLLSKAEKNRGTRDGGRP
jgi:hypothetical protein